jgi:hypothetical protein
LSCVLWNTTIQCSQEPAVGPHPKQKTNPTRIHFTLETHFNTTSYLRLGFPNDTQPSGFPAKFAYAFFISPMPARCPAHLTFFKLIIRLARLRKYHDKPVTTARDLAEISNGNNTQRITRKAALSSLFCEQ